MLLEKQIIRVLSYLTIVALLISITLTLYIYIGVANDTTDPYYLYFTNKWIIFIQSLEIIFGIGFIATLLFILKTKALKKKTLQFVNILSAFAFVFLNWFELYYGSTFYYGEVRDKQGFAFPLKSSIILSIAILNNIKYKWVFAVIINTLLILLWQYVQGPWRLQ